MDGNFAKKENRSELLTKIVVVGRSILESDTKIKIQIIQPRTFERLNLSMSFSRTETIYLNNKIKHNIIH